MIREWSLKEISKKKIGLKWKSSKKCGLRTFAKIPHGTRIFLITDDNVPNSGERERNYAEKKINTLQKRNHSLSAKPAKKLLREWLLFNKNKKK